MEEAHILLLTEQNRNIVMDAICEAFNTNCDDTSALTITGDGYELNFCVATKNLSDADDAFLARQISRIHRYFESIDTDHSEIKEKVLEQIGMSSSLVIIDYSFTDEDKSPELLVFDIASILLKLFCGLILAEHGSYLLDENLQLVFSDQGESTVKDFEPCEQK